MLVPLTSSTSRPNIARRARQAVAVLAFFALATAPALAANHDHTQSTIVVSGHDYGFDGPSEVSVGWHPVKFENHGEEIHHLQFARLNDGVTPDQFFASLQSEGEAALRYTTLTGGVGVIAPGSSAETLVDFTQPGTYVELCFIPNAEGVPHLALGMTAVIQVTDPAAGIDEPTADIEVHMFDFAYTMPDTITAGLHTWKVINDGPQPHEMVVMKLNDGVTFDDFVKGMAEGGESGPMPGVPMGGAQGLQTGLASYLEYDLEPGTYVAFCQIPDQATGAPHIALGMVKAFTVAAAGN